MWKVGIDEAPLSPTEELASFKKLAVSKEYQHQIPELPEKREITDKLFFILCGALLLIEIILLCQTLPYASLTRLYHGYDNCGNICGTTNSKVDGIECSGKDMTDKPYIYFPDTDEMEIDLKYYKSICVEDCSSNETVAVGYRCFKLSAKDWIQDLSTIEEAAHVLKNSGDLMFGGVCVAITLCFGFLALFRYMTAVAVWTILVMTFVGIILLIIVIWEASAAMGAILLIFAAIISIFVFVIYKKIPLIIRILQEAVRAMYDIPLLFLEPLSVALCILTTVIISVIFDILIMTAGELKPLVGTEYYGYEPIEAVPFAIFYNTLLLVWFCKVIIGVHRMVIAGAISTWYFSPDKTMLVRPIYYSVYTAVKYHLGTVAMGSFILSIATLVRWVLTSSVKSRVGRVCLQCCLGMIEGMLIFITEKSYIMTAMHGQSFYKSGKRAVKLLRAHIKDVLAVEFFSSIVITMSKLTVFILTCLIVSLFAPGDSALLLFFVFMVSYMVAHCFFLLYEVSISTIFLCYCEDITMNDGMERPYLMSVELMKFIDDARVYRPEEEKIPEQVAL